MSGKDKRYTRKEKKNNKGTVLQEKGIFLANI